MSNEPDQSHKPASLDQAERILKDIRLLRDAYEPGEIRSALNAAADRMDVAASHIYRNAPQPEPAPAQGVTVTGDLPIEVIDCQVGTGPTKPAEPVSATPIEPVALRHFTGSSTIATEYHDVTPAALAGKVWEIDSAWERLYSQNAIDNLLSKLAEARRERDAYKLLLSRMRPKPFVNEPDEDRAAELQAKLDEQIKLSEAISRDCNNTANERNELWGKLGDAEKKLAAETAKYSLSVEAMTILQESLDQERAFSQSETARADGAHNAAIDKGLSTYYDGLHRQLTDAQIADAILALKVPQ